VGVPEWGLVSYQDRVRNQARLGEIASGIAGRPVSVRCPGVVGRIFGWDIVEGSVRFDAAGRPGDETQLRAFACAELDAIAEGERTAVLACVARSPAPACGQAGDDAARAVDVLTHEAVHMAGIADEGETECRSLQTMAWTAQRLGASLAEGQALAARQYVTDYPRMPQRYQAPGCTDGGALDVRPADPVWP
jgi:hypothetical protein